MNISAGDVGFNFESICCGSLIDGDGHWFLIKTKIVSKFYQRVAKYFMTRNKAVLLVTIKNY